MDGRDVPWRSTHVVEWYAWSSSFRGTCPFLYGFIGVSWHTTVRWNWFRSQVVFIPPCTSICVLIPTPVCMSCLPPLRLLRHRHPRRTPLLEHSLTSHVCMWLGLVRWRLSRDCSFPHLEGMAWLLAHLPIRVLGPVPSDGPTRETQPFVSSPPCRPPRLPPIPERVPQRSGPPPLHPSAPGTVRVADPVPRRISLKWIDTCEQCCCCTHLQASLLRNRALETCRRDRQVGWRRVWRR